MIKLRLFIAINFNEDTKNKILNIMDTIIEYSNQGKFVSKEHMHLTLEFLGEISEDRVKDIISAMENLNANPFTISLSHLGYFKGRGGNIYWFGINENKDLMSLQGKIHGLLLEKGFKLEDRDYKPHLTIGRKIKLIDIISEHEHSLNESISKIKLDVNSIELMESKNIKGKLIYTRIHSKILKDS